jgi:sugar/nucleoside kinase (ribokinase family)
MRNGIVLAGSVILDIVNIIDHWPAEEQVAFIHETAYGAGGPPHNAAAGLVKLGAPFPVTLRGAVGDDAYGEILLASAQSYGLDTSQMKKLRGIVTSHTYVMSSASTGRRTFFHQPGVSAELDTSDLLPGESTAKLFYLGSPGVARKLDQTDGWRGALKEASAVGMKTCLELVPIEAEIIKRLVPPCLPHCDYLVVNDHEAQALTGMKIATADKLNWDMALKAAHALIAMGVRELVAIHHPDGAIALTRTSEIAMRGSVHVPQHEIKGTVGAGDAFYAGMLFGIHEGWKLEKCLDLANAAAATSLHSPTTSASIRPWAECLAYAEKHGLRPVG